MSIPTKYDPSQVESKWYDYWLRQRVFESQPDDRDPFVIVIPPPNVTGVLHMGHMLNNTLQDVLVRRSRLTGKNACWVPGTDHASIATEAKVVAKLKDEGKSKWDIGREAFLKEAWNWTEEYGGVILDQLKKLGCSCNWSRYKFTMDEDMSASVVRAFVHLHEKGLIYRGYRMVNWDPEAKTTLSDEEVIYKEQQGKLYYLKYRLEGSEEYLSVATTRPETIFGDTAVCVNPEDNRYKHLVGTYAFVPVCNRRVPIIADSYVDLEFGTGCLKVTPAHDENDKAIGERHDLEFVDIFNEDGTLNAHGIHYEGKDRFRVRKEIAVELEDSGLLLKTETHTNKVGTSERTGAVIEPRLSDQWFLKMKDLAEPAIKAVLETNEVRLHPGRFENIYRHWMENIRDWNISRQLWWGQQIPAYYYGDQGEYVVAMTPEEALNLARQKSGNPGLTTVDLRQDDDVLDTWFSSWLWPISVFGGILEPDNENVKYYYPTSDLVTGPDILFFWVARMIMAGYEFQGKAPFTNVYLTGLVRDTQGRKMSKSLGNSPDALDLISRFGADGVRVGLMLSAPAGNDLLFDEALCEQGRNFANKVWNAFRLFHGWEVIEGNPTEAAEAGLVWYQSRLNQVIEQIEDHFTRYRVSDALMAIYKLIWDDFCSWLLEVVKPAYGEPIDRQTHDRIAGLFEQNLILLHPFMPFLTEEVWQNLRERQAGDTLCLQQWPEAQSYDQSVLGAFEKTKEIIAGIRTIRKEKQISPKESLELWYMDEFNEHPNEAQSVIIKLANISRIEKCEAAPDGAASFRVGNSEYFVPVSGSIDLEAEREKIQKELDYTRGFLASVEKKLSNERFVSSAPAQVVELERKKASDAETRIETLLRSLENLN